MRFEDKLKKYSAQQLWQEYCGFLDFSLERYMYVQKNLMQEQISVWVKSGLGKKILNGKTPATVEELREQMPLTTYSDYADILLSRRKEQLCAEPSIWIETTWEGGIRPVKAAPYSRAMLDTYRHNLIAAMMMASARKKGECNLKRCDRILYGGAPLPYATGLMPSLFEEDIHFTWLPDNNNRAGVSFSERIKKGFAMALSGGVDYFFGIGSVANYITESFGKGGSGGHRLNVSVGNALRYVAAKHTAGKEGRGVRPGDIFRLKAFFYAGTDAHCYRERLTKAWSIQPVELAAGTESTGIGSESWEHKGMVLFPNACFYEFIPESEMLRNLRDASYVPRTILMDEVSAGENYEIVLSVLHGGAFMRYRIGDMYRCLSAGNGQLPRFTFLDRTPSVIDIAGFTRITEYSMQEVIRLSRLSLGEWFLKKEFDRDSNPFLHLYTEIQPDALGTEVTLKSVLTEHLSLYFRYFDSDYEDLRKLLAIEPLQVTILRFGTIASYKNGSGREFPKINPDWLDVSAILHLSGKTDIQAGRGERKW